MNPPSLRQGRIFLCVLFKEVVFFVNRYESLLVVSASGIYDVELFKNGISIL